MTLLRASVFLWVKLVVASILGGMAYGDRVSDLQKRLDALPPELEELYDRILSSLDSFYLEHAAQYFTLIQASDVPPSLLVLACADEDGSFQSALRDGLDPFTRQSVKLLHETMRRRINSRCKGLLEIGSSPTPIYKQSAEHNEWFTFELEGSTVQYLHRTVKDYMEGHEIQERLKSAMQSNYDPHLSHCIGTLITIKHTPAKAHPPDYQLLFRTQIQAFLYHAGAVFSENQGKLQDLMEEFNSVCTTIARGPNHIGVDNSSTIPWIYFDVPDIGSVPFNAHLLSLATRCGILLYVMASKIEQKALIPAQGIPDAHMYCCLYQSGLYPLLLDAVTVSWDFHLLPRRKIHVDMVEYLLSIGADPNEWVTSSVEGSKPFTVWRAALAIPWEIYNKRWKGTDDEGWRDWLRMYELMLRHGAGQFKDLARLRAQESIQRLSRRAVFSVGEWGSLIKELSQGREIPDIYTKGKLPEHLALDRYEEWPEAPPSARRYEHALSLLGAWDDALPEGRRDSPWLRNSTPEVVDREHRRKRNVRRVSGVKRTLSSSDLPKDKYVKS
jgi:hypothetical protein